jgi:Meiotically Up-regulated Gene 113 (MUG113) protein
LNTLEHLMFVLMHASNPAGPREPISMEEMRERIRELADAFGTDGMYEHDAFETEALRQLNLDWAERYLQQGQGHPWLYVIHTASTGFYKVGKANVPLNRMRNLQIGNPFPLSIVHSVPGSDPDEASRLETRVHEILDPHHLRGEWFDCPLDRVIAAIEQAIHEDIDGPLST